MNLSHKLILNGEIMSDTVDPVPAHCHTATPYLVVGDATKALEFYKAAFNAEVLMILDDPSGKVGHAEIKIGDSTIMLADEYPDMNILGPLALGGSPVSIHLYVKKVDEFFAAAVKAGAIAQRPVENMFYGDRMGSLKDPFGHTWHIASRIEILTEEQIKERMPPTKK